MTTKSIPPFLWIAICLTGCVQVGGQPHRSTGKMTSAMATVRPKATGDATESISTESRYLNSGLDGSQTVVEAASFHVETPPSNEYTEQDHGVVYTLPELEQMALRNNPSLAALNALSRKASGLRQQVVTRPNPTLGYFGQQLADRGTDQQGVFVEQEIVRGNKLALNREALSHTVAAQRWEIETQRFRVLTDVRVLYFEAIAAQQQLDAIKQFELVAKRGVEVALDRKKADEGSLIEVLQSKTLSSEISLASEQTLAAFRGAWRNLAAVAGLPDSIPPRLETEFGTVDSSPNWEVAYTQILSQSPERAVAEALVCEKLSLLRRQQVQKTPNISTQLGTGYDNGTNSGLINVQVGAPMPVFNKNTGNISAAQADYAQALANVKRIEQSIQARLARASQEFESALASVRKYEIEILPQVKQSLELSEEAYKAGELDFLQVFVVRRSYFESSLKFIQSKAQLAQANAKVDGLLLTGGLDSPQDYTNGDGIRGQSFGGQ